MSIFDQLGQITASVTDMREQMAAKRRELTDIKGLPIHHAELVGRFSEMVDAHAERFARVPPSGQTWTFAASMFRGLGNWQAPAARLELENIQELFVLLCFFAGDVLKAGAPKLLEIEGWTDGPPTAERPEMIARLERELAQLEAKEEETIEQLIKDASKSGVEIRIAHRQEVTQRRENEARRQRLADQAVRDRQAREAAINQRATTRATGQSEYLTRFRNRHSV